MPDTEVDTADAAATQDPGDAPSASTLEKALAAVIAVAVGLVNLPRLVASSDSSAGTVGAAAGLAVGCLLLYVLLTYLAARI